MCLTKNQIGNKYGRLTVLERSPNKNPKSTRAVWRCACQCGNIIYVEGYSLRSGNTKSCGCYGRQKASQCNTSDIVGKRFDHIVVSNATNKKNKYGEIIWKCICDCGKQLFFSTKKIKNSKQLSCNDCKQYPGPKKDLTGLVFGKLTVLQCTYKKRFSAYIWRCKCSCQAQTIIDVPANHLKDGHVKSCGCMKSYGQQIIGSILSKNNIIFEKQKSFPDLKTCNGTGCPKYDFFVDNRYIIQYDGYQHFYSTGGWNNEKSLKKNKEYDRIKNEYCFSHDIPIIRIPYTVQNISLDDVLLQTSSFLVHPTLP